MFDTTKLRAKMVEKFHSVSKFATHMGVAVQTVIAKLNGKREITKSDVCEWSAALEIPVDEIGVYFFTPKV